MSAGPTTEPLTRLGDSTLYAPVGGATWVFLLWDSGSPPTSLPFDDTWADRGTPPRAGWYVFLPAPPDRVRAPGLERALRAALSAPTATGLVWALDGAGFVLEVHGTVVAEPDADGRPVVAADAPIALPPGLLGTGFPKGMRLALTRNGSGTPTGVIAAFPMVEDQPWTGIEVPLTGALTGCLTFSAMVAAGADADRSTKIPADVRVDPLRPFDPRRTRITPIGYSTYALVADAHDAYWLLPVAGKRP